MTWELDSDTLLLYAGKNVSPSTLDTDKADKVVAAVNAAVTTMLGGDTPSTEEDAELARSVVLDGLDAFRAFDVRNGVLSVGPDGDPVRIGVGLIPVSHAVMARYHVSGMA